MEVYEQDLEDIMSNELVVFFCFVQLKREISTMKLIKHPNVVEIIEVMASKTKIYIVLELVNGGELFDKIVRNQSFLFAL